jgi:sulfatase maturation enzyme AslB (radical SAM superfamily)
MKRLAVRALTTVLPRDTLRKLYSRYIAQVFKFKYGDPTFPRIFSIEINSHCNRACTYCPNFVVPQKPQLMPKETFDKIVERLRDIKYSGVVDFIFFSEPTLHPQLAERIAQVREQVPWCSTRICTNGDLLTEEKVEKLVSNGLDRIYVMRHNPTPAGWVERIKALSRKYLGIFVLMDIDILESTNGLHDFEGLVKVKKLRGRQMKNGKPFCDVHTHVAQIGINGDWLLCCVDYGRTTKFGNLLQEDIISIWKKPGFSKIRRDLLNGVAKLPKCQECPCIREPREGEIVGVCD